MLRLKADILGGRNPHTLGTVQWGVGQACEGTWILNLEWGITSFATLAASLRILSSLVR